MLESPVLIRAIEKQPSLWDPSNKDYHKNLLKDGTWNKVCQDIYSNWDKLSKTEKHEKKQDARKRWNNIRDYYKKDFNSKNEKYQYSDLLEFLKPVTKRKRQQESHDSDSDDGDDEKQTIKKKPAPSSRTTTPNRTPKTPKQTEPKKIERNPFDHSILSSVLDREEDSDFLFLKSLLPDVKKLTDEQKFDFKLGIMHLYRTITRSTESTSNTQSTEDKKDYSFIVDPLSTKQDD